MTEPEDMDLETENKSLKADILETIQSLLDRPEMFSHSAESLEGQFFNMIVLVAPFAFSMTSEEARTRIILYCNEITKTNSSLSSVVKDVDTMAFHLKRIYQENFEFAPKEETIH